MSDALTTHETAERPKFGIVLSIIAILITLGTITTLLRAVGAVLLPDEEGEVSKLEIALDFIVGGWLLYSLLLLMTRRRRFIAVYAGLLLFNILVQWIFFVPGIMAVEESPERNAVLTLIAGQTGIAVAWLLYLAKSTHLRAVCSE
jgi:hypothetical protein